MQWGNLTVAFDESTKSHVAFPKIFPHQCFNVMASIHGASGNGANEVFVYDYSATGANFWGGWEDHPENHPVHWLAVGY